MRDLVSNKETAVPRRQRSERGEFGIKRIDRGQITTRLALRQIEWRRANAPSNSFIFLRWWFYPYQLVCLTLRFTIKVTLTGTLQLDLTALIKPATNARSCKIPDATNPAPTLDLFKQKRCYGWWSTSSLQTGTLRDTVGILQNTVGVAGSSLNPPKERAQRKTALAQLWEHRLPLMCLGLTRGQCPGIFPCYQSPTPARGRLYLERVARNSQGLINLRSSKW